MGETKRSLIERLWEKTDAAGFYSRFTRLTGVKDGKELKGLCPLHEDRHPSFFVKLETGAFHCFGCGAGGGPLQFYAALFDLSPFEAAARLRSDFGLKDGADPGGGGKAVRVPAGPTRPDRARRNGDRGGPGDKPSAPDSTFIEIYQALLDLGRPLHDPVLEYFEGRRIRPETVERFGVAFLAEPSAAAESLRERFPEDRLLASGVFRRVESGPPAQLRLTVFDKTALLQRSFVRCARRGGSADSGDVLRAQPRKDNSARVQNSTWYCARTSSRSEPVWRSFK
jgi:DNA primase